MGGHKRTRPAHGDEFQQDEKTARACGPLGQGYRWGYPRSPLCGHVSSGLAWEPLTLHLTSGHPPAAQESVSLLLIPVSSQQPTGTTRHCPARGSGSPERVDATQPPRRGSPRPWQPPALPPR